MFKFLVLVSLIIAVQARSFSSFQEALEHEISKYDFEATHEHDLNLFNDFKSTHQKQYETKEEEQKRYGIFRINLLKIKLLNALDTAEYGVGFFSDLDESEFEEYYTGMTVNPDNEVKFNFSKPQFDKLKDLPEAVDWRQQGAVTPVKDQARCGSCWSFAATGSIEAQNKIVNGDLLSFSEQELVDCDPQSHGCKGGLMTFAYEAIEKLGGLELEQDYPYTAQDGECNFKKNLAKVKVESYVNLNKDEDEIAQYVAQKGPVAIGINAGLMQHYKGGIARPNFITKWMCSPKRLNHGVLIVGFGSEPKPHWIIKNSWTEKWGRDGYYYIYRGENACGVREMASAPVVAKN